MSATPEGQGADARFQTVDWDAKLAEINAAHAAEHAAVEGDPARDDDQREAAPEREAAVPTAEAGQESPPEDTPATPPPAEEVRVSKKEWDDLQRRMAQYGQNLQQQRQEFEQRVQQALAGQGPDIERKMADAAREGERRAIKAQIAQVNDPGERRQWEARYQAEWDAEDRQLATERERVEAQQLRTQAEQQIQQAQQYAHQAQAQVVATNMRTYLEGYSPNIAARAGQLLGAEVAEDEVRAFVTRPEIVELAAQAAYRGPNAVNELGEMLVRHAAIHVRDQRAAREASAKAKREGRDSAGLGRDQGGQNAGRPPVDLDQYKSTKDKSGNWDAMLAALSEQQGIPTSARR